MKARKQYLLMASVMILAVLAGACAGPTEAPPEAPPEEPAIEAPTEAPPEEPAIEVPTEAPPEEPAIEVPISLKWALVLAGTLEEPWYSTSLDSVNKLVASNPYGVEITVDIVENIWGEDSQRVMREYAEAGYDIVWNCTGSDSDYIMLIQDEFPDVLFAHSGGGGTPLGKNSAHVWGLVHEPTYLMGMIAGMMTETDVIGMVGSFPSEDVNMEANSYFQGARDVNPNVVAKVTFINSWWDPDMAKEAAVAQIAAGADFIYPTIFGTFEAMSEAGIHGFGNYVDQSGMADPGVILASTLLKWDVPAATLLDLWYEHVTTGDPYDVTKDRIFGLWADDGTGMILMEEYLPADVLAAVEAKMDEIIAGDFVVPMVETEPITD